MHGSHCLSHDFTWLAKSALEKQTRQLSLVLQQCMESVWVWLLAGPRKCNWPSVTFRSVFQNPVTYLYAYGNLTWSSNHHYTSLSTTKRVSSYYWECVVSVWVQVSDSIIAIGCIEIWRTCIITWTWHSVIHYGIKSTKRFFPGQNEGDSVSSDVRLSCHIKNLSRNTCSKSL